MNSIFKILKKPIKGFKSVTLAVIVSTLFITTLVTAATTINENINTAGTLTVTGESTMATTTFSGNIDLGFKEITSFLLEKLAVFPTSPVIGQTFYSTASSTPYTYNGSQWKGDVSGATFVVAASNSLNKEKADYICDGTADDVEIQAALDALPTGGGKIQLLEGTYVTSATIVTPDYSNFSGSGWSTLIDTSALMGLGGSDGPFTMGDNSILSDLKIQGDISTVPASWNETIAGNHSTIERIWIDQMGMGINTTDKQNVHINDCKFTNIRNSWTWAAAIHNSGTSKYIYINNVYIANADRGIETENGASSIYANGGYIYNIDNVEGFTLDVHTHSGLGNVSDVVYENFYLEETNELHATGASTSDMVKNITFRNITMKNPIPTSGVGIMNVAYAENVLFDNVRIFGDSFSQTNIARATNSVGVTFNEIDVDNETQSNLQFTNSVGVVVKNSRFAGSGSYLASLKSGVGTLFDNVLFDGYVTNGGLQLEATCSRVSVINSTFIASSTPGSYGIAINSDYSRISNNTFLGLTPPWKYPIDVDADYTRIYGNYFTGQLQTGSVADGTLIYDNEFTGGGGITDNGAGTNAYDNRGYNTATSSTATITSGNTYATATHYLDITPEAKNISVTPTNNMGSSTKFWISDIGASDFRINVDQDPTGDATFSWSVRDN